MNTSLPNIPTDSLYKFMAILGLIILISGGYFYAITTDKFISNIITTSKQTQTLKVEVGFLLDKVNEKGVETKITEIQEYEYELKKLLTELNAVENGILELEFLESNVDYAKTLFILSSIIGTLLIIFGFWWWYSKIQYYQDLIIKREANKQ